VNSQILKFAIGATVAIVLSACGGSNSAPPPQNIETPGEGDISPGSGADERRWIKADEEYGHDLGFYERDGEIFTSTHKTRDGINFESYHTADLNFLAGFRQLSYIDENNKYYLFAALSDPGILETDRWVFIDWATFGDIRYIAGTSDYLISASYQRRGPTLPLAQRDVVEFTRNDAQFWRKVELPNGDNIVTNGIARPADNKAGTILLTDVNNGGWRSTDGGRTWEMTLDGMGYLDLTIGSDDYANEFYAFSKTEGRFSDDGGETWAVISVPQFSADMWVAGTIDSSNGDVLIWGLDGPSGEDLIYKSSDKGTSWSVIGPRTPANACVLCGVPDLVANEYGYFVSADDLYFLTK